MEFSVYQIELKPSGYFYIGFTSLPYAKRIQQHYGANGAITRGFEKAGNNLERVNTRVVAQFEAREEALEYESYLINKHWGNEKLLNRGKESNHHVDPCNCKAMDQSAECISNAIDRTVDYFNKFDIPLDRRTVAMITADRMASWKPVPTIDYDPKIYGDIKSLNELLWESIDKKIIIKREDPIYVNNPF